MNVKSQTAYWGLVGGFTDYTKRSKVNFTFKDQDDSTDSEDDDGIGHTSFSVWRDLGCANSPQSTHTRSFSRYSH